MTHVQPALLFMSLCIFVLEIPESFNKQTSSQNQEQNIQRNPTKKKPSTKPKSKEQQPSGLNIDDLSFSDSFSGNFSTAAATTSFRGEHGGDMQHVTSENARKTKTVPENPRTNTREESPRNAAPLIAPEVEGRHTLMDLPDEGLPQLLKLQRGLMHATSYASSSDIGQSSYSQIEGENRFFVSHVYHQY